MGYGQAIWRRRTIRRCGETVRSNRVETYPRKASFPSERGNNFPGIRTDHVEVQLMANGEPDGDPVRLDESNNWTHQ